MSDYKVLITTSGTGSRLGSVTKNLNKSLIEINDRKAIDYILDSYDENIPIVVTLGYLGDQVKAYLLKNYPKRKIEFVEVDLYEGEGSSLLYSIRCAKYNLQCPFIFHACDTILLEEIPTPDINWTGGYVVDPSSINIEEYRSHILTNGFLDKLQERGANKHDSIHIGLTAFSDHESAWNAIENLYEENPNDSSLCDVQIIEKMMEKGDMFKVNFYKVWLDTGNSVSLNKVKNYFIKN